MKYVLWLLQNTREFTKDTESELLLTTEENSKLNFLFWVNKKSYYKIKLFVTSEWMSK